MRKISSMEMWKLADELSVVDAAILITGNDPSEECEIYNGQHSELVQRTSYEGFDAAFKALKNAIMGNRLAASLAYEVREGRPGQRGPLHMVFRGKGQVLQNRGLNLVDYEGLVLFQGDPDWHKTLVQVPDLKAWLRGKSVFPEFFFPEGDPDSLTNRDHPRFSGKLACAVAAWYAIPAAAKNKSVKQTVEAWVTANGVQFGLSTDEGTVPATAIEDIAKVVNWQTGGGVSRTGGEVPDGFNQWTATEPDNFENLEHFERPQDPFARVLADGIAKVGGG